eukprot:scaffold6577_cov101-Isochrysis_galbana.AAC.2
MAFPFQERKAAVLAACFATHAGGQAFSTALHSASSLAGALPLPLHLPRTHVLSPGLAPPFLIIMRLRSRGAGARGLHLHRPLGQGGRGRRDTGGEGVAAGGGDPLSCARPEGKGASAVKRR